MVQLGMPGDHNCQLGAVDHWPKTMPPQDPCHTLLYREFIGIFGSLFHDARK